VEWCLLSEEEGDGKANPISTERRKTDNWHKFITGVDRCRVDLAQRTKILNIFFLKNMWRYCHNNGMLCIPVEILHPWMCFLSFKLRSFNCFVMRHINAGVNTNILRIIMWKSRPPSLSLCPWLGVCVGIASFTWVSACFCKPSMQWFGTSGMVHTCASEGKARLTTFFRF